MNDDVLTLSLRPKTLDDLIGQESIVASIRSQIAQGRIPKCWMFQGESRSGKTTLARILAVALNKSSYENFGVLTDADWEAARSLEIIDHNASNISGIDGMRDLVARVGYFPMAGRYRVIILDEAQRLTKDAQNCLLKPTEDSTINIWMICTTDPGKIIDTLQKRCIARYKMNHLDKQGIYRLIGWALPRINPLAQAPAVTEQFMQCLYDSNITAPGVIIAGLERYLTGIPAQEAITGVDSEIDGRKMSFAVLNADWPTVQDFLMKANAEEIRTVKYQLLGILRRVALGNSQSSARASELCIGLSEGAPMEDIPHAAWLTGKLVQYCSRPQSTGTIHNQYQNQYAHAPAA